MCCRLKTHLQGLPVCRESFTGETWSSWFVWLFIIIWRRMEKNPISPVKLGFLKLGDFLNLLFSHWTNSLRRETWRAKPFLCRVTVNLPVLSVFTTVGWHLRGKCVESAHRREGARALCVLWLISSCCCSVSARVGPIGMCVLITVNCCDSCLGW